MFHDKLVLGGLFGVLANGAMGIFQFPLWKLKIVEHPLGHYAASLFLNQDNLHHMMFGSVISFLANCFYSAFWGIVFVYVIYLTGKRYFIVKGLLFGAFLWLFSFGGFRSLPIVALQEVMPGDVLYYLFFHLIFGLALGFLVKRFGENTLEPPLQ